MPEDELSAVVGDAAAVRSIFDELPFVAYATEGPEHRFVAILHAAVELAAGARALLTIAALSGAHRAFLERLDTAGTLHDDELG